MAAAFESGAGVLSEADEIGQLMQAQRRHARAPPRCAVPMVCAVTARRRFYSVRVRVRAGRCGVISGPAALPRAAAENHTGDPPSKKGVQMKRLTVLLLVCALAAFGLAACGDDDDDNNGTTGGDDGHDRDHRHDRGHRRGRRDRREDNGGGGGELKVAADPERSAQVHPGQPHRERRQDEGRVRPTTRPCRTTSRSSRATRRSARRRSSRTTTPARPSRFEPGKYTYFC